MEKTAGVIYNDDKPPSHKWLRFIIGGIVFTIAAFVLAAHLQTCNHF